MVYVFSAFFAEERLDAYQALIRWFMEFIQQTESQKIINIFQI